MPHHITHEHVQAWLDVYAHAWDTYDADDVAALFTEDAEYRWHPADEPEVGRDAIVEAWLNPGGNASDRDEPGTYKAEMQPYAVDGSRAVAFGTCTYWTDATRSTVAAPRRPTAGACGGDGDRHASFCIAFAGP